MEIAVATAKPVTSFTQALVIIAMAQNEIVGTEISISARSSAWPNSQTPRIIAAIASGKNKTLSKARDAITRPSKVSPTAMEGNNFRPAFLLIASFRAWRSDIDCWNSQTSRSSLSLCCNNSSILAT